MEEGLMTIMDIENWSAWHQKLHIFIHKWATLEELMTYIKYILLFFLLLMFYVACFQGLIMNLKLLKQKFYEDGLQGGNKSSEFLDDIIIRYADRHNLLRPETVESLFVLHRITQDPK